MAYPSTYTATEQALQTVSLVANADIRASQFCFVSLNSNGYVVAGGTTNVTPMVGVLQNKPTAQGEIATVAISGLSRIYAGSGGVTAGTLVTADASGYAIAAVAGNVANGYAVTTAAAGYIADIIVCGPSSGLMHA